jgi:hypothetical protein
MKIYILIHITESFVNYFLSPFYENKKMMWILFATNTFNKIYRYNNRFSTSFQREEGDHMPIKQRIKLILINSDH